MADLVKLEQLAQAISASSSRIREYALAQTAVTREQEARLLRLEDLARGQFPRRAA